MARALILLIGLVLAGCSTGGGIPKPSPLLQRGTDIFFPPLPDTPMYQYLYSISSNRDIEAERSFGRKLLYYFIIGEPEPIILNRTYGVLADKNGSIYVADNRAGMVKFFNLTNQETKIIFSLDVDKDKDKKKQKKPRDIFEIIAGLETFTDEYAKSLGRLISPVGLAMDAEENLYVSDSFLRTVYVFDKEHSLIKKIGQGTLDRPAGIAIDKKRKLLLVADTGAHKVLAFNLNGGLFGELGERGEETGKFNFPTNVWVDGSSRLYVSDSMNFRIQIFDEHGKFIQKFGKPGDAVDSFSKAKGVAVDRDGNVYVVESFFDGVRVFDREGKPLISIGGTGGKPGEFYLPSGIFIDDSNKIYISDSFNQRVQVFQYLGNVEEN